jgi:hypothetical protein
MQINKVKIIFIAVFLFPTTIFANGAAWMAGLSGSTPGPVKQNVLYLEEEHVTMEKDGVIATFHVVNPSKKDITLIMGFPFKISIQDSSDRSSKEFNSCEDIWIDSSNIENEIGVAIDGKDVSFKLNCRNKGDYPVVINWTMTFPAGRKTAFTVTYPLIAEGPAMDVPGLGQEIIQTWSYIVHTGAFWSRPIGKAQFEFCGEPALLKCEDPKSSSSTKWSADGFGKNLRAVKGIKPTPSSIDCENKCIIWERKNWVPQKKDNISVTMKTETLNYSYFEGNDAEEFFMRSWCGKIKNEPKHFGSISFVSTQELKSQNIESLVIASYVHSGGEGEPANGDWENPFFILPEHLAADYRILLFRYLRNWISASHGHEFKDTKLKECYTGITKKKEPLSKIERNNIDFLKKQENYYLEISKKSWEKVRKNLLQDN